MMPKRAKLTLESAPLEEINKFVHGEKAKKPKSQKSRKPMTVYISPEVHKNLKILAATTERELSEITELALVEYIDKAS